MQIMNRNADEISALKAIRLYDDIKSRAALAGITADYTDANLFVLKGIPGFNGTPSFENLEDMHYFLRGYILGRKGATEG